jgi:hypothetical protein
MALKIYCKIFLTFQKHLKINAMNTQEIKNLKVDGPNQSKYTCNLDTKV